MTAAPREMPPPARRPVSPARWPALIAGAPGCLALGAVVVSFPLGIMAHEIRGDGIQLVIALPFAAVACWP
jgi:hypothetical protein